MSNVVAFRRPDDEIEPDTFEPAWRMLPDAMRRRSESKAKCHSLWDREAARLSGQEDLLARLRTYLRDDKDIPRTGGPGLQVVLRAGRLEHWVPMSQNPRTVPPFEDAEVRAAIVQSLGNRGEAFCRSYLDRCRRDGPILYVPTETAMIKLRDVAHIMKSHGYVSMRKQLETVL